MLLKVCVLIHSAHELGHKFEAVHDEIFFQRIDARSRTASNNNIMTAKVGVFYKPNAMYYFPECSIGKFKKILTPDRQQTVNYFGIIIIIKSS